MIQKFIITFFLIIIFLIGIRFLKKLNFLKHKSKKNQDYKEDIVDLEKDPKTNEYKPKQKD